MPFLSPLSLEEKLCFELMLILDEKIQSFTCMQHTGGHIGIQCSVNNNIE
jgi:hypothetical protein